MAGGGKGRDEGVRFVRCGVLYSISTSVIGAHNFNHGVLGCKNNFSAILDL